MWELLSPYFRGKTRTPTTHCGCHDNQAHKWCEMEYSETPLIVQQNIRSQVILSRLLIFAYLEMTEQI